MRKLIKIGSAVGAVLLVGLLLILSDSSSWLVYYSGKGNIPIAKILLKLGADVNYRDEGGTPLLQSLSYRHFEMAHFLLDHGAGKNIAIGQRNEALAYAIGTDNLSIVKRVYGLGNDINARDDLGNTPILIAAGSGVDCVEVFEYLLKHGANLKAKTNDGETVVTIAKMMKNTRILSVLKRARYK